MVKRRTTPLIQSLAMHLAEGGSVKDWCRTTGTAERTAYLWSKLDECTSLIAEVKERALSSAIRKLASGTSKAADVLIALLDSADEKIQLAAARAILGDLSTFDGYVNINERLAELERMAGREPLRFKAQKA